MLPCRNIHGNFLLPMSLFGRTAGNLRGLSLALSALMEPSIWIGANLYKPSGVVRFDSSISTSRIFSILLLSRRKRSIKCSLSSELAANVGIRRHNVSRYSLNLSRIRCSLGSHAGSGGSGFANDPSVERAYTKVSQSNRDRDVYASFSRDSDCSTSSQLLRHALSAPMRYALAEPWSFPTKGTLSFDLE